MSLNRRNTLIGLGTLAVGGGVLSATGAFTQVEAQRTVRVEVAGDANALLGLQVSGIGTGSDVVFEENGLLTIDFGATGADGLNLDARTTVGELDPDNESPTGITAGNEAFKIVNNGGETIDVSFQIGFHADQSGEGITAGDPEDYLKLWTDVSDAAAEINAGDFDNLVAHDISALQSGEEARVVIQVDTVGLDETDVDVTAPLFDETGTITANAQ